MDEQGRAFGEGLAKLIRNGECRYQLHATWLNDQIHGICKKTIFIDKFIGAYKELRDNYWHGSGACEYRKGEVHGKSSGGSKSKLHDDGHFIGEELYIFYSKNGKAVKALQKLDIKIHKQRVD